MRCVTATRNSVVQKWRFRVPKNHDKKRKTRDANIFGQKKGWEISLESFRGSRVGGTNFPRKVARKFLKSFQVMDQIFYHRCLSVFEGQFFQRNQKTKNRGENYKGTSPLRGLPKIKIPLCSSSIRVHI